MVVSLSLVMPQVLCAWATTCVFRKRSVPVSRLLHVNNGFQQWCLVLSALLCVINVNNLFTIFFHTSPIPSLKPTCVRPRKRLTPTTSQESLSSSSNFLFCTFLLLSDVLFLTDTDVICNSPGVKNSNHDSTFQAKINGGITVTCNSGYAFRAMQTSAITRCGNDGQFIDIGTCDSKLETRIWCEWRTASKESKNLVF